MCTVVLPKVRNGKPIHKVEKFLRRIVPEDDPLPIIHKESGEGVIELFRVHTAIPFAHTSHRNVCVSRSNLQGIYSAKSCKCSSSSTLMINMPLALPNCGGLRAASG